MIRSRLRLKALGLCAMALGLMALSAGAAQAEVGANWMLNGANVTSTLLPEVQIGEIENKTASLLTKISGASVSFLCTGAQLIGAKLELEGKVTSGGKVKFTGCSTLLNGSLSGPCKPKGGGEPLGTVLTNAGKGLLVLHKFKEVVGGKEVELTEQLTRIEPVTPGGAFATIEFDPEAECSLPEKVPVFGVLYLKDCKNEGKVELASHLIEQGLLTHMYAISDTAEHAANIDGSATVVLGLAHEKFKDVEGKELLSTWSGLPG